MDLIIPPGHSLSQQLLPVDSQHPGSAMQGRVLMTIFTLWSRRLLNDMTICALHCVADVPT